MLKAKAIVVSTMSGLTAKKVSIYRPYSPIIVTTPRYDVASSLSLNFGVYSAVVDECNNTDDIINTAKDVVNKYMECGEDDRIIITGSIPIKSVRGTNFIKIENVK